MAVHVLLPIASELLNSIRHVSMSEIEN